MADYKLAKVHMDCTVNNEYCEEKFYGSGCEGCRFYDWVIDKVIEDLDDEG